MVFLRLASDPASAGPRAALPPGRRMVISNSCTSGERRWICACPGRIGSPRCCGPGRTREKAPSCPERRAERGQALRNPAAGQGRRGSRHRVDPCGRQVGDDASPPVGPGAAGAERPARRGGDQGRALRGGLARHRRDRRQPCAVRGRYPARPWRRRPRAALVVAEAGNRLVPATEAAPPYAAAPASGPPSNTGWPDRQEDAPRRDRALPLMAVLPFEDRSGGPRQERGWRGRSGWPIGALRWAGACVGAPKGPDRACHCWSAAAHLWISSS